MKVYNQWLYIFLYIVVVCPLSHVFCKDKNDVPAHYEYSARFSSQKPIPSHHHKQDDPCDLCPRHGKCVPRVQCPAHVRSGSQNPLCHIGGPGGPIGVCCFTGHGHAAESDKRPRSASLSATDIKHAHNASRNKLSDWLSRARVLARTPNVAVNDSSPSFGHHLMMKTYDPRVEKLSHGALLNLFTVQELKARDAISENDINFGFLEQNDGPFCPPQPSCQLLNSAFKSLSGECNNPRFTSWGAANTAFLRLLPPQYGDGVWSLPQSSSGRPLPSARSISSVLLPTSSLAHASHNMMFMQFGQFIVHDISAAIMFTNEDKSPISCCINDGESPQPPESRHWACSEVLVAPDDVFYRSFQHSCMNFVRSQLAPATDCSIGYANPMNGATHHLDLSHLYGSTEDNMVKLRDSGGLLKSFNDFGRQLPPLTKKEECLSTTKGGACFDSGDHKANMVISLTALHTIWIREHNRVATVLARLNPGWDNERLYWETRRILQAEYQHVVYNEWLPLVLGPKLIQSFGLAPSLGYSSQYDPQVNPSISAEFAAAAMRFGHSTVDGKITLPKLSSDGVPESVSLAEVMFSPARLRVRPVLDRLLAGLTSQRMQNVDPFVTESLTRYLFHGGNPYGLDLASINIQRGRDFGIRPYNDYRRLTGQEPFRDFGNYPPSAAMRLSSVYQSPEDVDLWIGGLLEEADDGNLVGTTFANIIADQFARTKNGDRYFYEHGPDVNPGAFTPAQLAEIRKVTLSRLICDNRDGYELSSMPSNAFLSSDMPGNTPVLCESSAIPTLDLNRFKEI